MGAWRVIGSVASAIAVVATLGACKAAPAAPTAPKNIDPEQVDSVTQPESGACRNLTPAAVTQASDATRTVVCSQRHTAQTYTVGELPENLIAEDYDSPAIGAFAYKTCSTGLRDFLGADESLALRTILTWAWFRPSVEAWDQGARWYRCDVIGGNELSPKLALLPETAQGLLQDRPQDRWLICVDGATVGSAPKTPCSQPHSWRAVTTIKVGEPQDPYPGDHAVEIKTRSFCSDSVSAWLSYPLEFDYAYTWFHQAEWDAGNRRSVCWAKTDG